MFYSLPVLYRFILFQFVFKMTLLGKTGEQTEPKIQNKSKNIKAKLLKELLTIDN